MILTKEQQDKLVAITEELKRVFEGNFGSVQFNLAPKNSEVNVHLNFRFKTTD